MRKMASNDVITKSDIEGLKVYIDGRIVELEKKFDAKANELKTEINVLERKVELNATKIDMLQHYQTIGFTVMGAMIGFAAMILTLAPTILELFRDKRKEMRNDEIRGIFREEFAKLKEE